MNNIDGDAGMREEALKSAAVWLGQRVREIRRQRGLTQGELAERLSRWGRSYHPSTITKLEQGARPTTFAELTALATELGVSERDFFRDPSPEDLTEREIRWARQKVDDLQGELNKIAQQLEVAKVALEDAEARQRDAERWGQVERDENEIAARMRRLRAGETAEGQLRRDAVAGYLEASQDPEGS